MKALRRAVIPLDGRCLDSPPNPPAVWQFGLLFFVAWGSKFHAVPQEMLRRPIAGRKGTPGRGPNDVSTIVARPSTIVGVLGEKSAGTGNPCALQL